MLTLHGFIKIKLSIILFVGNEGQKLKPWQFNPNIGCDEGMQNNCLYGAGMRDSLFLYSSSRCLLSDDIGQWRLAAFSSVQYENSEVPFPCSWCLSSHPWTTDQCLWRNDGEDSLVVQCLWEGWVLLQSPKIQSTSLESSNQELVYEVNKQEQKF